MKKSLWLWQLAGFTFTVVLGTLLHFLYDWTGSIGLAPFSAVNESTWEHMKILFFPMLIFAWIQFRFFKEEYPNFWCVKLAGIALGVLLVPALFYTYNGAFGKSPDWLNVLFFFLSAGGGYLFEIYLFKRLFKRNNAPCKWSVFALVLLYVLALAFVLFTFIPPRVPLFLDPVTGTYGLG